VSGQKDCQEKKIVFTRGHRKREDRAARKHSTSPQKSDSAARHARRRSRKVPKNKRSMEFTTLSMKTASPEI
jgi:hypothetical protein